MNAPMALPPHELDHLFADPENFETAFMDSFMDSDVVKSAFSKARAAYKSQEEDSKNIPRLPAPSQAQAARLAFVESLAPAFPRWLPAYWHVICANVLKTSGFEHFMPI